jgi:hypothetical protein
MLSENSISEKLAVPEKPQHFLWNNSFLMRYQNRCKVLYIVTYILQNAPSFDLISCNKPCKVVSSQCLCSRLSLQRTLLYFTLLFNYKYFTKPSNLLIYRMADSFLLEHWHAAAKPFLYNVQFQ